MDDSDIDRLDGNLDDVEKWATAEFQKLWDSGAENAKVILALTKTVEVLQTRLLELEKRTTKLKFM